MRRFVPLLSAVTLVSLCAPAWAHFIFVGVEKTPTGQQAALWFSESASPGEPEIIGKIAPKTWVRTAGNAKRPLEMKVVQLDDGGAQVAPLSETGPFSVESIVDYGAYSMGKNTVLLQYYAKSLNVASADELAALARAEDLTLDIVPRATPAGLELAVLFQGKPAAGANLFITDPQGETKQVKLDEQGQTVLASPQGGRYTFRSGYVEADRTGNRDGKDFTSVRHYCTLTMPLPLNK
jgi:hypothetical protein